MFNLFKVSIWLKTIPINKSYIYVAPFKFCKLLFFSKSVVMFLKINILSSAGGTGIHSNWLNPKFKCWMSDKYCNKKTRENFQKKNDQFIALQSLKKSWSKNKGWKKEKITKFALISYLPINQRFITFSDINIVMTKIENFSCWQ